MPNLNRTLDTLRVNLNVSATYLTHNIVDEQNHLLSRSRKSAGSSHLQKFCVTKKSFNLRLTPSVLPYLHVRKSMVGEYTLGQRMTKRT